MIAVIDVSGTNLTSLANALTRLDANFILTHDSKKIENASHVIMPGVGTAAFGMNALRQHGLIDVLIALKQPLLGICLGMQLLMEHSEEGDIPCLGLLPGRVQRLSGDSNYPVPHMGWNQLHWKHNTPLRQGLTDRDFVYFVHSYAVSTKEHTVASCSYKNEFSAIVNRGSVYGMQFHPEKSAETGLKLLSNFISLESVC